MTDDRIAYRVGDANDLFTEGSRFIEYDAAEEDALLTYKESGHVIGIWMVHERTGHAEIIRLVYANCIWFPDH